jgi:hypothetical protein
MARPLMQHGIGELESLFATKTNDVKVLRQLELELSYRQVPRAFALAEKVTKALRTGQPASPPPASAPKPQLPADKRSFSPLPSVPVFIPPRPKSTEPAIAAEPTPAVKQPVAAVSVADAYKILGVSPSASWEQVEQARRQLVDEAHPSKVARLSPERRAHAQQNAKRANAAYGALAQVRSGA